MKVDIIIPALNQIDYTKKCIVYLKANTTVDFGLIFIDNASTDGTSEFVENFCKMNDIKLTLIKNEENNGVAKSWNQGIRASKADYIAIINNDIVPAPNWLSSMIKVMEEDENIWATCPVFTANTPLSDDFPNNVKLKDEVSEVKKFVGFCFVLSRKAIEGVGLFDEQFEIGWYEDTDIHLRLCAVIHPPMIVHNSYIHHFGSKTINEYKGFSKHAEENRKKFIRKYGGEKEEVLARFSGEEIQVQQTLSVEEIPKEQRIELKEAFKISVPNNYTPELNSKIPVGEHKIFDEIPNWAKGNIHYLIEKVKVEAQPELEEKEEPKKNIKKESIISKIKERNGKNIHSTSVKKRRGRPRVCDKPKKPKSKK